MFDKLNPHQGDIFVEPVHSSDSVCRMAIVKQVATSQGVISVLVLYVNKHNWGDIQYVWHGAVKNTWFLHWRHLKK